MTAQLIGLVAIQLATLLPTPMPAVVSYQGHVAVDDEAYTGTGYFKIAILDVDDMTLWTHDGTGVNISNGVPSGSIDIEVQDGFFHIALGEDTDALPSSLFYGANNPVVRVWFSDSGDNFELLTPDLRLSASPYAFVAASLQGLEPADFLQVGAPLPAGVGVDISEAELSYLNNVSSNIQEQFSDLSTQVEACGDITEITAGTGLTGSATTGTASLAIDTAVVPRLSAANVFTASPTGSTTSTAAFGIAPSTAAINGQYVFSVRNNSSDMLTVRQTASGPQTTISGDAIVTGGLEVRNEMSMKGSLTMLEYNGGDGQLVLLQDSSVSTPAIKFGWAPNSGIFHDYNTETGALHIGVQTAGQERFRIDSDGYVHIKKLGDGAPPMGDCDVAGEAGRLYIDSTNENFYICNGTLGWFMMDGN